MLVCVFSCMYAWMCTRMHASVCGYLTVKVSRETDDDSMWIWAEGRILLKRGHGHNILYNDNNILQRCRSCWCQKYGDYLKVGRGCGGWEMCLS